MSEELKALEALAAKQRTQRGNMMMLGNADPEIVDAIRVIRATDAENQRLRAEVEALREGLRRIATVDMGGGFLGAQACRQVANQALTRKAPQ